MAFGAKKIFPIDTIPGTAVGIAIPFNAPAAFFPTYTTKDAIKNNLLNYLLTNRTERYFNINFGANLRAFIFEQITSDNIDSLKESIQLLISQRFTNVRVDELNVLEYPDTNEIKVELFYTIINTGITDQVEINFAA